jgi:hypothetical protein
MDATYIFNPSAQGNIGGYPLYHTSYEVFSMVKKFVDPDFTVGSILHSFIFNSYSYLVQAHRTVGQFMGVLALLLSETPVIQFNVTRYTTALTQAMNNLKPTNATVLGKTLMNFHLKHTKS